MISSAKLSVKSLPVTVAKAAIDYPFITQEEHKLFDSIDINDVKLFLSGGITACKRR